MARASSATGRVTTTPAAPLTLEANPLAVLTWPPETLAKFPMILVMTHHFP